MLLLWYVCLLTYYSGRFLNYSELHVLVPWLFVWPLQQSEQLPEQAPESWQELVGLQVHGEWVGTSNQS